MEDWIGELVCLDTLGSLVFTGKLASADESGFTLLSVDVHDLTTSTSTRDLYFMTLKENIENGSFQPGRASCFVLREKVVSLTRLSDIVVY